MASHPLADCLYQSREIVWGRGAGDVSLRLSRCVSILQPCRALPGHVSARGSRTDGCGSAPAALPTHPGTHPGAALKLFKFSFILFCLSANKLAPQPCDWLLAKLQLWAQLAEFGLVGFFYCNLFTYFPSQCRLEAKLL